MSSKSIENTEQVRELERAILGGLMLETERYDAVSEIIAFSDFEGQDHQNIFQSMGELLISLLIHSQFLIVLIAKIY